ncbi:MAG: apolipoprotein N-acyltransferase [Pseudomonadota bacterium]
MDAELPLWLTRLMEGRRGDLLALIAGAPLTFAFAPFGWFVVAIASLAVLYLSWLEQMPRRAAWRGFLFGAAGFLGGTYWLYISLHEFGEAPLFIAIPMMLGLVAVMASYFAFAGWLVCWLQRLAGGGSALSLLALMPGALVLTEWLRGWVATGFPWFAWGYSQTDSTLIGWAPVFGVLGVSLAVALSAGTLALLAVGRGVTQRALALGVLLGVWLGGLALERVEWSTPLGAALEVGVVQGGISQDLKWQAEQLPKTKALYRRLTDEHWDADLLIWPEAAIPALANRERDYFADLFNTARRQNTGLLIGAIQAKGPRDDRRYYNSVFGVNRLGVTEYHKRHLVPFGEYFPVPHFVRRWMRSLNLPYSDFESGPAGQAPLQVAGQRVGVSICYEDVFGNELRAMLPAASFLANVSNDAWFGGSVAPYQHLQIARMRAIEVARPMVRSTNSGISAYIEHDGALREVTGLFDAVVLRGQVQPREGLTPYVRWGDWPTISLVVLMLLIAPFARLLSMRS